MKKVLLFLIASVGIQSIRLCSMDVVAHLRSVERKTLEGGYPELKRLQEKVNKKLLALQQYYNGQSNIRLLRKKIGSLKQAEEALFSAKLEIAKKNYENQYTNLIALAKEEKKDIGKPYQD